MATKHAPPRSDSPRVHYTPKEAAPQLHPDMSPRTLERWRSLGIGPRFVKVGRRVLYTDEAIREYHAQQTRTHTKQQANSPAITRPRRR